MNKRVVITVVAILLSIVGATLYLLNASPAEAPAPQETKQSQEQATDTSAPAPEATTQAPQQGTYKDYEASAVTADNGTTLLFFHAPWCTQCRALDADIREQGVPANVVILKVDYDTSQSLRQKYGVTIQTTIVKVDGQGNLVEKYVSYDEPTLKALERNLL